MKTKLVAAAIALVAFGGGAATTAFAYERHPDMRAALSALYNARNHLSTSNRDFGGYRVKALNDTNQAISDVQTALRYDK